MGPLVLTGLWVLLSTEAVALSIERAVELAVEHSPELRALAFQVAEEDALVDDALRMRNPQLRIADLRSDRLVSPAIDGRPYSSHPFEDLELGLRWSPPNLGSWAARRARAERRVDQAEAELARVRREIVARVRSLHAEVVAIDRQLELAETALELSDQLKQLTRRRLESQAATVLDQSLTDLDYLDALTDREGLESERREVYHELVGLVGGGQQEFSIVADGQIGCGFPSEPAEFLVKTAIDRHPQLAALRARIEEVESAISETRLELVPWIDFMQLSYVLGGASDPDAVRLRFGVTLPLLDWNRAEIAGLRARRNRVDAELDAYRERVTNQVRHTYQELIGSAELHRRFEAEADLVAASMTQLRRALEVGETDLLQMALVQSRTLRARRAGMRAFLRCQQSAIELWRLVGDVDSSPDSSE